ncbi:MAG: exonuclease domain-containing protein, partial [Anaeroplasmataceae bacterium]
MNNYLKLLKDNNVFDFNNNSIQNVKIEFNKITNDLILIVDINKYLFSKDLFNFINYNELYFKSLGVKNFNLEINYIKKEVLPEIIDDYLKIILDRLKKTDRSITMIEAFEYKIIDNNICYLIDGKDESFSEVSKSIHEEFKNYFIDIKVIFQESKEVISINKIKENNLTNETITTKVVYNEPEEKKTYVYKKKVEVSDFTNISQIPNTQEDLSNMSITTVKIRAKIYDIQLNKTSTLYTLKVTDNFDSIVIKKWVNNKGTNTTYSFKLGDTIEVVGEVKYDLYSNDIILFAETMTLSKEPISFDDDSIDTAQIKRVELHVHTKMSAADGLVEPNEIIKKAIKFGHKAIAFTDHNACFAVPEIDHSIPRDSNFKPIYGVELNYINESKFEIVTNSKDLNLREATYVVFDIETTGFSQNYDTIIEIAAVKIKDGDNIDKYSSFVNPQRQVSNKIKNLTNISSDDLKDAPLLKDVLLEFNDFIKDSILVAHNAQFDVGFIRRYFDLHGILNKDDFNIPYIDTLNLIRVMYSDRLFSFNLKAMSSLFAIKQESHHRAIDDARVTGLAFLNILKDLYSKDIVNLNDLNLKLDSSNIWRSSHSKHLNVLAKNQTGLKNMYKILSDSLTNHLSYMGKAKNPSSKTLTSVIEKHKDGLIILSGCYQGEVFDNALNNSIDDLIKSMSFYDVIEVQPLSAYAHLFDEFINGEEVIKDVIRKIIEQAKKLNKLVVATGDVHYLNKTDKFYRDILIKTKGLKGSTHELSNYNRFQEVHFRTTDEMLEEFSFLDYDVAYEIVVTNTNVVNDMIDHIKPFPKEMFVPRDDEFKDSTVYKVDSMIDETKKIVNQSLLEM